MKVGLILTAAGTGSRSKLPYNKVLYKYNGDYLINHTITKFLAREEIVQIIILYNKVDLTTFNEVLIKDDRIKLVEGSYTRQRSVLNGVRALEESLDYVFVHDSSRPNISENLIANIFKAIESNKDCYSVGIKVVDSLRIVKNNKLVSSIDRDSVIRMQTPQIAKYSVFKEVVDEEEQFTDETGLFISRGYEVELIAGEEDNFKVTNPEDLRRIDESL